MYVPNSPFSLVVLLMSFPVEAVRIFSYQNVKIISFLLWTKLWTEVLNKIGQKITIIFYIIEWKNAAW